MIGIGIISLIGNILHISKPFFIDIRKPVTETFCRSAVKSETDSGIFLPGIRCGTQPFHYPQGKFQSLRFRMADAGHKFCHLVKPDISQ